MALCMAVCRGVWRLPRVSLQSNASEPLCGRSMSQLHTHSNLRGLRGTLVRSTNSHDDVSRGRDTARDAPEYVAAANSDWICTNKKTITTADITIVPIMITIAENVWSSNRYTWTGRGSSVRPSMQLTNSISEIGINGAEPPIQHPRPYANAKARRARQ